ncbi:hypothetical protein H0H93_016382 [Arthromyces matolae]|nr:hypothetical protein H0H93_016382 [Arthromyces matolae]
MLSGFLSSVFLAICAVAAPSIRSSHHVVHERRAAEPIDWQIARRLEGNRILPMRFGLTQRNLHQLEDMLKRVSDPDSPTYGQHWTPSDVAETFAPSSETISAVVNWLSDAGISRDRQRLSVSKGWIDANATVEEVEDLLKTEYHVYTHSETGDEQIGWLRLAILFTTRVLKMYQPTVHFNHRPVSRRFSKRGVNLGAPSSTRGPKLSDKKIKKEPSLATCDEFITLDCLRALYSVEYKPVATHKNSYGIGIDYSSSHPPAFAPSNFSPSLVGVKPKTVLIDGAFKPGCLAIVQTTNQSFNFNGESDLDLEYAMGLTNPQPITLLQTGAGFDNWLDAVDGSFCTFEGGDDPDQVRPESCGIIAPPNVVSTSYGQDESTITAASAMRQCQEYAKNWRLTVSIQVTCPYVTAVGATQVNPGSTVNDPEGACEQVIFSGGGFSNIFP